MSAYSPISTASKQSIKPSESPSLSPRKRPYDPFLDAPSAGADSGPSTVRPHPPQLAAMADLIDILPEEAMQDVAGQLTDDGLSVRNDDEDVDRDPDQSQEGEMEMDEMDTGEPEEAEDGMEGCKCRWSRCGKIWKDQEGLVKHIHQDHIGINKEWYTCKWDGCRRKGDKQVTRHALITHVRAHTGERPYTCTQPNCNKTFTRSDAMNKHLRSIHLVPADQANPRLAARRTAKIYPSQNYSDYVTFIPRPGSHDSGAYPMGSPSGMDSPAYDSMYDSPMPHTGLVPFPEGDQYPIPLVRHNSELDREEKAKSKSRSRTTSGKKPAAPRKKQPPANPLLPSGYQRTGSAIPSPLQPPVPEYYHQPPHREPPHPHHPNSSVTVGPDGSTYVRFGSDADLMTDPDLYETLPRVRNRPVLQVTQDDLRALEYVRSKHPRRGNGPQKSKGKKKADGLGGEEGQGGVQEADGDSDDSFDEGAGKVHADESHLEIGRIGEPGVIGERSVFGRSRWAARYIMAKAKLMLADEEMRMRLAELNRVLDEEEGLRRELDAGSGGR